MNFGEALLALKAGKSLQRAGWNGKGQFIYLVPAASYPAQTGAAKEHFGEGAEVPYNAYFAIKGVDGKVSTWAPSTNDCIAEDWRIYGEAASLKMNTSSSISAEQLAAGGAIYEGTKQVIARAMNRGEYNKYRGWEIPADENPSDEGYLVEYVDGGKANHPNHAGYISWSPKDVFERAYKPVLYTELPPHQQRVMLEVDQLNERLSKLQAFCASELFSTLDPLEKHRLKIQAFLMNGYLQVLIERTKEFKVK